MQAVEVMPRLVKGVLSRRRALAWLSSAGFSVSRVLFFLLAPLWSHALVLDLHFVNKPVLTEGQSWAWGLSADPNRTMLWAGQRWPFPNGGEEVAASDFAAYVSRQVHGDKQVAQKVHKWCDLYIPNRHWPEDVTPSPLAAEVGERCAHALQDSGYFSFAEHCFTPNPQVSFQKQELKHEFDIV
eukprot:gnl/TRDRNA2_/TRDRNA2_143194_c0_seq1.p1 gnl/TRDRNA2_/TRDRNA2_143194_c0~~gnl/TRDRNA2_/TRDRNA2_143194_c0_seq1.p1  ORF type:complete len:194 (-),score=22.09 gnl/TRDRNA2_/TRDRNA2_143194_c0_seq1:12-563(-)